MSIRQSISPGRAGAGTLDDSFEQHDASAPLRRNTVLKTLPSLHPCSAIKAPSTDAMQTPRSIVHHTGHIFGHGMAAYLCARTTHQAMSRVRLAESTHVNCHCADAAAAAAAAVAEAEAAADAEANEEVENLLESYFMQIDRTYNRLKSLQEFMGCEPGTLAWKLTDTPSEQQPVLPFSPCICVHILNLTPRVGLPLLCSNSRP